MAPSDVASGADKKLFTKMETDEISNCCRNATECTKSHIKFQKFSGCDIPSPQPLGSLPQTSRKGGMEKRRDKEEREEKGRERKGGDGRGRL